MGDIHTKFGKDLLISILIILILHVGASNQQTTQSTAGTTETLPQDGTGNSTTQTLPQDGTGNSTTQTLPQGGTDNGTTQGSDTEIITKNSPDNQQCTTEENICRNGDCRKETNMSYCSCKIFYGTMCENLNIRIAAFKVGTTTITFTWDIAPNLVNYYSIHYRKGMDPPDVMYQEINMTATSITVENLPSDDIQSVVCIVANETIASRNDTELISTVLNVEAGKYCVNVFTGYSGLGPYAVSALGIGIAMVSLIFVLLVGQGK